MRRDAYAENNGKLFGDVSASLAWRCMRKVAEVLLPDPAALPQTPAALVDPQTDYDREHPRR
jgi:hypothetical protein